MNIIRFNRWDGHVLSILLDTHYMDEKLTNTHVQQYISVSFEIYFNV